MRSYRAPGGSRCLHVDGAVPSRLIAWPVAGLSVRPRPSTPLACGWCVGCVAGFWVEKPHADRPPAFMDTLDDVSVQFQLGDDGGREVNPGGVELDECDRLFTGLAQSL